MSRSTRGNKRLRLIASFDGDVACRKNAAVDGGKTLKFSFFTQSRDPFSKAQQEREIWSSETEQSMRNDEGLGGWTGDQ